MPSGLLVLKLGGSLLETGRLAGVLARVAQRTRPVVVVPGGGPFADQVRQSQAANGFDDATAHRLALFAMHQMANVIVSRTPHFATAASREEFAMVGAAGMVPVWVPSRMAGADPDMPKSWDMTSDSLAAWLAGEVGAAHVALVKSCAVDPDAGLECLTTAGTVDPLFAGFVERHGLPWSVVGAGDTPRLDRLLGVRDAASGGGD
jgi:aspartokinase-like uncharacterized kinase